MCAVPGASALVEEEFNFSDTGLGGEDSSPIPLLSISPFGLPLTAELNCGNEVVGCESILDTSRWVKNRLPGFMRSYASLCYKGLRRRRRLLKR